MSASLSATQPGVPARKGRLPLAAGIIAIVALSLAAWLAMLVLMPETEESTKTSLRDLPSFVVGWIIMLTAMMLPSELNYIGAFTAVLRGRDGAAVARPRIIACFIAGYGIAWLAYGLVAYCLHAAVRAIVPQTIAFNEVAPLVAGLVLLIAGLYQVSSLKKVCLNHCRSPISFFARHWARGDLGAVSMGLRHGLVCVGCCWAMMAVMFAVGAMSLVWMALLTLFMFAEKVLPQGERLTIPIAGFLWLMGAWIAISPATAPFLKDPMVVGGMICRSRV